MDSHWAHGRPAYRCRHGYNSAQARPGDAPPNSYVREDVLLAELSLLLGGDDGATLIDRLGERGEEIICGKEALEVQPIGRDRKVVAALPGESLMLGLMWESARSVKDS